MYRRMLESMCPVISPWALINSSANSPALLRKNHLVREASAIILVLELLTNLPRRVQWAHICNPLRFLTLLELHVLLTLPTTSPALQPIDRGFGGSCTIPLANCGGVTEPMLFCISLVEGNTRKLLTQHPSHLTIRSVSSRLHQGHCSSLSTALVILCGLSGLEKTTGETERDGGTRETGGDPRDDCGIAYGETKKDED